MSKIIRITCVGDSITQGLGASDINFSYPSQLQKLLGEKYKVLNFGLSGATVIKSCYMNYISKSICQKGLESKPDIVIILLGTNDLIFGEELKTEEGQKTFSNDYERLIKAYQKCGTNPTIMICSLLYRVLGEVDKLQNPIIKNLAKLHNLIYLDLFTYSNSWSENEYLDGLHPTDSGYNKLAKFFANAIIGYTSDFEGYIQENKNYRIISKLDGLNLAFNNNSKESDVKGIKMESNSNEYSSQVFNFISTEDGYYKIKNIFSEKYLIISLTNNVEKETKVIQSNLGDDDNSKWIFEPIGDGLWKIIPKLSISNALSILDKMENISIQAINDENDNNQKWVLYTADK